MQFTTATEALLRASGADIQSSEEITLAWGAVRWRVASSARGYDLGSVAGDESLLVDVSSTTLEAIEKTLVMRHGRAARAALGLPAAGYLPHPLEVADGFTAPRRPSGGKITWNDGREELVIGPARSLTGMGTFISQYLQHPLEAVIATFTQRGPGILSDEAPGVPRPFRLPERTHAWLLKSWPQHYAGHESVAYEETSAGGWRFDVVDGGFASWRMHEKSNVFTDFDYWVADMECLQLMLAWDNHHAWAASKGPIFLPRWAGPPEGFTVVPAPGRPRFVHLLRRGKLIGIFHEGDDFQDDAVDLAVMLTIGLDALEASVLNESGKPALTKDRLEAGMPL